MKVHTTFLLFVYLITTSGLLLRHTTYALTDAEEKASHMVGIHLGSTHSSVAVIKHLCSTAFEKICKDWPPWCSDDFPNSDKFQIVLNEQGCTTTPSCVAFTDSGILIGEAARDQKHLNPQRTICEILPLVGQSFDDQEFQTYIQTLPYKVVNIQNKTHIEVSFQDGVTKVYSSEEILALMLGKMKEISEAYTGNKIQEAVVSLQHNYNEKMREKDNIFGPSLMEAGRMAGLSLLRVMSSRFAAILAPQFTDQVSVLVYNLGGSVFDVSLQVLDEDRVYTDVASREDKQLGGKTFDKRVVDHFISLIKRNYKRDISKDIKAIGKLQIECEKAKISLGHKDQVMIKIESLADGIMLFEEPLTRETFEELNMDLFNKTIDLAREVMKEGDLDKTEIVLVGGNARIPKIQHMLKEVFGKQPLMDVNPDESLAFSATKVAGWMTDYADPFCELRQLASWRVGIETFGGIMTRFVEGYGFRRASASRNVTNFHDGQTAIEIKIFAGESELTKCCHHVGTLEISNLPPAPRGVHVIKVKGEADTKWDLHVTVEHEESQQVKSMTFSLEKIYYWGMDRMPRMVHNQLLLHRDCFDEGFNEDLIEKEVKEAIKMQQNRTKFDVVDTNDLDMLYKRVKYNSM